MVKSGNNLISYAFEQSAPHLSNISEIKQIVNQIEERTQNYNEAVKMLKKELQSVNEVTLQTDIRILLNEIEHLLRIQESLG